LPFIKNEELFYTTNYMGVSTLKKYEYKCVLILGMGEKTTRVLNQYGQEGWELVSTCWAWHYFKRPVN